MSLPSDADALDRFRRAIVDGDQAAWASLCTQYHSLVRGWLHRHPASHLAGETSDSLVNCTFARFWQCVRPDRFGSFAGLPALLLYLKLCAHSVLLDDIRAQTKPRTDHADLRAPGPPLEDGIAGRIAASDLWRAVLAEVRDETELLVATLSFIHALKPREICEQVPDRVADVAEVYRIKRNLLDRLRRNETIRRLHI